MGQLKVIVGGQAGSEAKGACTAFLARKAADEGRDVHVIRVAGPNAGHTAYDDEGRKWALRQIPVAAVTTPGAALYIGPGSEVDLDVLTHEVTTLEDAGIRVRNRLYVDVEATILTPEHRDRESGSDITARLGSTGKGIGAARADRIMRTAELVRDRLDDFAELGVFAIPTNSDIYEAVVGSNSATLIEGTQGYVLGLHAGYYPQCTSSDCRAVDFLGMAGIDPHWVAREDYEAWVVMRTYPIRVAGNSGPLRGETNWEELGLEEERTTVTQKIRRVGSWNPDWAADAIIANGGPDVARISLSMADYIVPELAGQTRLAGLSPDAISQITDMVSAVETTAGARVDLLGTGPRTFIDLRVEADLAEFVAEGV